MKFNASAFAREAEQAQRQARPFVMPPCVTAADWLARDLPEPDFILGSWLSTTTRCMVSGATGIGKTHFLMALLAATAAGKPFLHWDERRPCRVLYVDGEMSRRLLKRRLEDVARRLGGELPEGLFVLSREDVEAMEPLNTPEGQAWTDAFIEAVGGVDLIIFDNIMSLLAGDMKDPAHWQDVLGWVRDLTRRGIGQIWCHHTGHDGSRAYGDSSRTWQLDTVLHLEKVERANTDVAFALSFQKARERTPDTRDDFEDVTVSLVDDRWLVTGAAEQAEGKPPSPKAQTFLDALHEALIDSTQKHNGRPAATTAAWVAHCMKRGVIDKDAKDNTRRSLLSKYRLELIAARKIACHGDLIWTVAE